METKKLEFERGMRVTMMMTTLRPQPTPEMTKRFLIESKLCDVAPVVIPSVTETQNAWFKMGFAIGVFFAIIIHLIFYFILQLV